MRGEFAIGHPIIEKCDAVRGELRYFGPEEFRVDSGSKIRFELQYIRVVTGPKECLARYYPVRADQFEMCIRVLLEHDLKSFEQDVDSLFRGKPPDKEELCGLALNASGL
jgi:hypothetical protein